MRMNASTSNRIVKLNLDRMFMGTRKYQDFITQKKLGRDNNLGLTSSSDNKTSSWGFVSLFRCASVSLAIIHLHNPALHLDVFIPFSRVKCHYHKNVALRKWWSGCRWWERIELTTSLMLWVTRWEIRRRMSTVKFALISIVSVAARYACAFLRKLRIMYIQ